MDVHQDRSESFSLNEMMSAVRCEWADDAEKDPCYATGCCMCLSVFSCTALCWFLKMRNFMCSDKFHFSKVAQGFIS